MRAVLNWRTEVESSLWDFLKAQNQQKYATRGLLDSISLARRRITAIPVGDEGMTPLSIPDLRMLVVV